MAGYQERSISCETGKQAVGLALDHTDDVACDYSHRIMENETENDTIDRFERLRCCPWRASSLFEGFFESQIECEQGTDLV